MSLQILSQYAGGPRVRATGWPAITTSGSGAASAAEAPEAAAEKPASAPASSGTDAAPGSEYQVPAAQSAGATAATATGGAIVLGRRAPKAPGGGASTLHGSRISESEGTAGAPAAPPAAES